MEKLKGTVAYGRTINLGNYNSSRIEFSKEFYLDESSFEKEIADLRSRIDRNLKESGLIR